MAKTIFCTTKARQPSRYRRHMLAAAGILILLGSQLQSVAMAESLEHVDGEHGQLDVYGELVDSPCRLSMDSRDQTVDLGTLAAASLIQTGDRSMPLHFMLRLDNCLAASGHIRDQRTDATVVGINQPVVTLMFTAPADPLAPTLIKLNGVSGIGLRITDSLHRDIRLGSLGAPQILSPGNNTLTWSLMAERTAGPLIPGPFRATADIRLSYD